jgi:hypothetical protein
MHGLILTLWCAGIAARAFAAFRLWRSNLIHRLPTLWGLLVVLTAQSAIALCLLAKPVMYAEFYAGTAWCVMLMEAIAPVGVFWAVVERYPRFRAPGTFLLTLLALAGSAACWAAGYGSVPAGWGGQWHLAVVVQRVVAGIMFAVLLGTRIFLPRITAIPIRRSAQRAADILTLHMGMALGIAIFTVTTGLRYKGLVNLATVANGLTFGLLCAVALTRESDVCPEVWRRKIDIAEIDSRLARIWEDFRDYTRMLDRQR